MSSDNGRKSAGDPDVGLPRERLHELYYHLSFIREVERILVSLYRQNRIVGGLYRSLGQESVAVGSAYALRRRDDGTGDMIAPAIRNLGSLFVMGADPADVMRQYMARGDGPSRGRETNVHFTDYDHGFIGLISHLGAMIGVMAGVALSFKTRGEDRVALAYAGDGMTSTGMFHEGFNLAAVRRLPLVVLIENNHYAYSTPTARQSAVSAFVDKAAGYGVPSERCDGNDVLAVHAMTKRAVEHARSGGGATLLEVETYRRKGHAEHDAQAYVPDGEIERWEARDPVNNYEKRLLDEGWATDSELDSIRDRVKAQVDEARERAEASSDPEPEMALGGVYGGIDTPVPWTRRGTPDPHLA